MRKNMYTVKANIQCKLSNSTPVSAVLSPLNDRYLTVFYDPIGLSFFDLKKTRITSIDPTFPSEITSYDSDGTWYVLGTKTGYLIFGNLYDTIDMKRFKVSTEPITFLLYDTPKLRVYWQTNKDIGIVDLGTRKVTTFKSHGTIIKCYGSHHGAIIVQRDSHVLGIFIEGKERPLILKSEIIDLSIDEMYSNQKSGKFYVLQRDHTVMFYTYSLDGIQFVGGIRPRQIEGEVLSLATFNELFVIGYNDGSIKFYNSNTQESKAIVDLRELSLSFLGDTFPNMKKLRLSNSIIPSIRDIGCTLVNLRYLSLARCNITSLDGISTLSQNLEELYLAFNNISDLFELMGMEKLRILDLEDNKITNINNIEVLQLCSRLKAITLAGNPAAQIPDYKETVSKLLPQLIYLDEKRIKPREHSPRPSRAERKVQIDSPLKTKQKSEPLSPHVSSHVNYGSLAFKDPIVSEMMRDKIEERPTTANPHYGRELQQPSPKKSQKSVPKIIRPVSSKAKR
ncbi:leucine-rich repeat-containing protein 56 isoform X3 [Histomonas meleagridis]|uniref:leucine-rich repeat-containing protein 56 isoform X3 n=1 Tax=Histomonas meleagridis TaxID=135588 RepID=UPI0035599112|nr:leucine-rich repeat-containing protein 56 isoform X3 [Histomonas meleagridis]KAH0806492.1 leucine-rich repeat-containing protein 56 isoform X3 [Histomonas meleagridis]